MIPLSRHKGKRYKTLAAALVVTVLLLVAGTVLVIRHTYTEGLKPVSSSEQSHIVDIPLNSSVRTVGKILKDKNLIRSEWVFERYIRNKGLSEAVQAGTYDLRPSQGVVEIVNILTRGKVATDLVTILPAQRLDEIRSRLINSGFSVADVDAALDPAVYAGHPALVDKPAAASLEGYIYPESFQKTSSTKPENIIRQSLDQMQKYLTPDIRQGFVRQGLNIYQGITLASIVEQEVSNSADRPTVAQVFLRRLREGLPLESNVTVDYGLILQGQPVDNPNSYESPYNTYLHTGLPPGPISNVSLESLNAVVNPSPTDWLYFVSSDPDEEGNSTTYFSKTLEEHKALVEKYCKQRCSQ